MQEKVNAACGLLIKGKFILQKWVLCKNGFRVLQMVQFECPRVIYPLVSFTFGSTLRCPFPLHAGKGKCCMWPVNKVEIHFAKIGFLDSKWSILNDTGSSTSMARRIHVSEHFGNFTGTARFNFNLRMSSVPFLHSPPCPALDSGFLSAESIIVAALVAP